MNKPIYCGSGKKQNDNWITATINIAKIKDHIEEYEGTKFVRLNINIKDSVDQYGKDVSISINKYDPKLGAKNKHSHKDNIVGEDPNLDPDNNDPLPF